MFLSPTYTSLTLLKEETPSNDFKGKALLILNETKPTDLSIEEYKTALVSGKIVLSLNQQNKILKATEPLNVSGMCVAFSTRIFQSPFLMVM